MSLVPFWPCSFDLNLASPCSSRLQQPMKDTGLFICKLRTFFVKFFKKPPICYTIYNMAEDFPKLNGTGEELTEKQLKWGYWFTAHRLQLYKGLIWFFIIFDILLGGYNLYSWGDYLFFGYFNDQKLLTDIRTSSLNFQSLQEHFAAKPIVVEGSVSFPLGDKTDALVLLRNPNNNFFVKFDYTFLLNGQVLERQSSFLLPGELKYLAQLGIKGGGEINFNLVGTSWHRISTRELVNPQKFIAERLQFETSETQTFREPYNHLTFNVQNNSFYNYWQADFLVLLKNYETIIGVEKLALDNFNAGEKRPVDLRIEGGLNPNNIQLVPDLNVFDEAIYKR